MKGIKDSLERVSATITILIDNTVMELIPGSRIIERISRPNSSFLAEHGFSALIETGGERILVDTGSTGVALEHNLSIIGLKLKDIDVVFLSHGHSDHTGGLLKVKGRVIAHPDVFFSRYIEPKKGVRIDLTGSVSGTLRKRLEQERGPVRLARGVITTGEIERIHKWEELDIFRIKRTGRIQKDSVLDDQGVVINSGKGLVVISGCSHAGIINTIEQAIRLTGVENIYCVIGGFHLIGPGEAKIERTIKELRQLKVKKIVPIHCTGFEAIKRISVEMPDEFEYGTAGCRIRV